MIEIDSAKEFLLDVHRVKFNEIENETSFSRILY